MKELWSKIARIDITAVKEFVQELLETLRSPQVEPQKAALVLVVVIAFALLLLALGLLIYSFIKPAKPKEAVAEKKEEEKEPVAYEDVGKKPLISKETQVLLVVLAAFLVILLAAGLVLTARPPFCNSCHRMKKEYQSWKSSTHRTVGCLSCHQEPGITGFLVQKTNYLRWSILTFTNRYDPNARAVVYNTSCNRCHAEVSQRTVSRYGIRVRHRDFLVRGDKCTDCHNTVAHGELVPVKRLPSMDNCVLCHNQKTASADCRVCHTKDIAVEPRVTFGEFAKVALGAPKSCRGCHPIDKCTACHGLEMPHPESWTTGGHARLAFTNRAVCWRCHAGGPSSSTYFDFCQSCHRYPPLHETAEDGWIQLHGPVAMKTKVWAFSNCYLCHRVGICDDCHVGKREVMRNLPPGHPSQPER